MHKSSLRESSQHCKAPICTHVPEQMPIVDPNRRPYTTERLLFTQDRQILVPARVPGPVPRCATMRQLQFQSQTAMNFTNRKTRKASNTGHNRTNRSPIPQSTLETTSKQVPVLSQVKASRFLTAIPMPFPTLTLRRSTTRPMQVSSSPRTGSETSCCACRRWAPLRP